MSGQVKEFGGLGGIAGCRTINVEDEFEMAVVVRLGAAIRDDDSVAKAMWSAMANVQWTRSDGATAFYSFRAAGDLIAAVRGHGNYMDWYCTGPYATVSGAISDALALEGWTHEVCS